MEIGNVMRGCRLKKNFSQEQISKGICSVSSLSRIENGLQRPSGGVFTMLVERMGEEHIFYENYIGDYNYEIYSKARYVIKYLERREHDKVETYLDDLRNTIERDSEIVDKGILVYKYIELLVACIDYDYKDSDLDELEVNQYGCYLYQELEEILSSCMNDGVCNKTLDMMEIRMFNLMAYARFLQKDYRESVDIWIRLIGVLGAKDPEEVFYPKDMAAIYSNISAGLSAMEMYEEAKLFASKGMRYAIEGGGLRVFVSLLWNRMFALARMGDTNKAHIDLALCKALSNCCKKDLLPGAKLTKLPNSPYLIQIF